MHHELLRREKTAVEEERAFYQDLLCQVDAREAKARGLKQLLVPWPNRIEDGAYSFGGEDLRTLFVTTAGNRPPAELAQRAQSGPVFVVRRRIAEYLDQR